MIFRRTRPAALLLAGVLALSAAHLRAEEDSPEDVARAYFAAIQTDGMTSSTRFMHPDALAEFKSMLMPVYVAEHDAGGSKLLEVTFPGASFEALEKMDGRDFMDGFMALVVAQTGDVPVRFDKLEVLGTVSEGDARHVLTRMTLGAGDLAMTQFEVLSFTPYEDTWRLQLNGDLRGLAVALRRNLSAPPPPPPPAADGAP